MTIENMSGHYFLTCDICYEQANDAWSEFSGAVAGKKEHGWKSKKEDGEWLDICPRCQEVE